MDTEPSRRPARGPKQADPEAGAAGSTLHALLRALGLLRQIMDPYFSRFGISGPQWAILRVLVREEAESGASGLSHKEIGRRLFIQPPSVTAVVDRLEREGLVSRGGSPSDRRVHPVTLTPAGRKLVRRVEAGHRSHLDIVFAGLGAKEQAELRRLLEKLGTHLGSLLPSAGKPSRSRRV